MHYQPIENYGVIGDMHTMALIGKNGSIDWFCFPHFDSPSIFASILDHEKGGHFKITPKVNNINRKQFYWPDTNVLVTRMLSQDGVGEIIDYMPVGEIYCGRKHQQLVRRVNVVRGIMDFRLECLPAFNYARDSHKTEITETGAVFYNERLNLELGASVPLKSFKKGAIADFKLSEGQSATFVLHDAKCEFKNNYCLSAEGSHELFKKTIEFWRNWLSQCTYKGRWREIVHRSALVLKMMTFEPTGAIVAAPTCSLPEELGGVRNWDYRYAWIRDAAFTLYAFMRIGFMEEAGQFIAWLEQRCQELNEDGSLQIMYGIDGRHKIPETTLKHLSGYKNSNPVRVGNDAFNQRQLDIYGELMDSIYLYNKHGKPISYGLWVRLRKLINWVCDNWMQKDEGIWEVRGGSQHFVYSKMMCWVAVDRALRLASKRSFPADYDKWHKCRDEMYVEIMSKGWNRDRQAFVQYYGTDILDAANLLMPLVFFVSPSDPRMLKTLQAIQRTPDKGGLVSNSLVYRYNQHELDDGLDGNEGTFNICTFWLVEALTRAGQIDEAQLMFEKMLGFANHLGLFSEQTGSCGEALGNFPQAFTHLALISSAYNLDKALG